MGVFHMERNNNTFTQQNNQHNNQNQQGEVNDLERKTLLYNQQHSNLQENAEVEEVQEEQSEIQKEV